MDLEKFPVSPSAKEMMSYVTASWYDRSFIGKWLYEVMGREIDDAKEKYEELREQIFPQLATWGLIYHEMKYGLTPAVGESYESRRRRILTRMRLRGAMNPERLKLLCEGITGKNCQIVEHNDEYRFDVVVIIYDGSGYDKNYLIERLDAMKPSHLRYGIIEERPDNADVFVAAVIQQANIIEMRQVI